MKTTADFLDDLRGRLGLSSDNKLALHLGMKRAQLGRYRTRRETFSDETALRFAALLKIEPDYMMACMAAQRAKTPETRSAWERIAAKVAAAVVLTVGLGGILHNRNVQAEPPLAPAGNNLHICANFLRRLLRKAVAAFSRWCRYLGLGLALAAPGTSYAAGSWSAADTARQVAVTGLMVMDWAQTRTIARSYSAGAAPSGPYAAYQRTAPPTGYYETNPFLGQHPSVGEVDNYFAAAIIAHAAISYVLPPGAWRQAWQYISIGVELDKTEHNYELGIRMSF